MRSYGQYCPAAHALDAVGERWTLLIVRELLFGPKRYTDLQDGLPGIGPNVLAARLRTLEQAGLIEKKRLPPPAASTVYELTALGEDLKPVLRELFHWGLQLISAPATGEAVKASYWLPGFEAAVATAAVPEGVSDRYEFHVGHEVITITATDGQARVRSGSAGTPDVVVEMEPGTLIALARGDLSPAQAVQHGYIAVQGDDAAAERCAEMFSSIGGLATGALQANRLNLPRSRPDANSPPPRGVN